jgi:outer membrane protein insertion porin family
VIRRELNLMPGDIFDELKVQRSRERLQNTGFFDSVQITAAPGEDEKTRNLVVDVEEGRTGNLSFGAGFSSVDGFIGFAEVSQSNFDIRNAPYFTGGGQKLRLKSGGSPKNRLPLILLPEQDRFHNPNILGNHSKILLLRLK